MRILHTSDWHLGRTFHGRVLDDAHAVFADHLVELARTEAVDAVVVSGDVYDRAIPPTDSVRLLDETLRRLSDITRVILTPGNHDSARRLGFASDLLREGLTIRARIADVDRPVIVPGPDGGDGLYVYALPYLDPDAARETLPPLLADRLGEEPTDAARTTDPDADRTAPEGAGGHSEKTTGDPPETASDAPARRLPRSHEAVVSGEVGRVELVSMTTRGPSLPPLSYLEISGGQMRDQTVHFFDLLRWITGLEPVEVYVAGAALVDPAVAEVGDVDTSVAVLRLANGALVQIDSQRRIGYGYDERIEVNGSLRMVEAARHRTGFVNHYGPGELRTNGLDVGWFERVRSTYRKSLAAFVEALEHSAPVPAPLSDGLRAQVIAEAATQSLRTGRPVAIPDGL